MRSSSILLALGFVGLLILLISGVWLYTFFTAPSDTTGTEETRSVFGSLFPFGRGESDVTGTETDTVGVAGGPAPRLRKVTDAPVAGALFVETKGILSVRYIERETGHIYETPAGEVTTVRLTNTTIPQVHDALWLTPTSTLLRVGATGTDNYRVDVTSTSTDAAVDGVLLNTYARVASNQNRILGITPGGLVELVDGAAVRSVYTSPITSMVPHLSDTDTYLASAPSGQALGSLYLVSRGELERVTPPLLGLEALVAPSGALAVSVGGVNQYALGIVENAQVRTLPLATLAQKCAWHAGDLYCGVPRQGITGLYPDDWLLGRVHFSDSLWKLSTDGVTEELVNLEEESGTALDAYKITVSPSGTHLLFIDRTTQTLWVATLTPQQ